MLQTSNFRDLFSVMALFYVVVMLCTLCMRTMVVQDISEREQEQENQ